MLNTIRPRHTPSPDETRTVGSHAGNLVPRQEGSPDYINEYAFTFPNGCSIALEELSTGTEIWYSLSRAQGFRFDWSEYLLLQIKDDRFRQMALAGLHLTSEEINADEFFGEFFDRMAGLPNVAGNSASATVTDSTDYNQLWPALDPYRIGVSAMTLNAQLIPFGLSDIGRSDSNFSQFQRELPTELYPFKDRISALWHNLMSFGAGEYLRGGLLSYEATISARRFVAIAEGENCAMTPEQIRSLVSSLRLPSGFVNAVEKLILK